MSPSVSKPEQEVQDRLCLITQGIPGRSLSWATTDGLKHEGKALIFMIGTSSCHGLNVKCPGIQHRSLNMSSPGGMGILEGSRTFGKKWVTKASSSVFVAQDLCLCSLSASSFTLLTAADWKSLLLHLPPHPRCPPLSYHEPERTHLL